jgi:hypothetical protein
MLYLILLILLHLHARLRLYYSRTLSTVGSLLRSEDTAFGVKNRRRNGSQKEQGQCSAKSSIKRRLRSVSVIRRYMGVVKFAVPIYALKERVLSYITVENDNK